jgi:hypothetical protein
MSMHGTMLNHARYRYFWAALALMALALGAYIWHQPEPVANGGTWLGYTLGTIAALLIVWLMLLGMRKRAYSGHFGTVRGWTSAHIYLGSSLIIVATLHCGFQFGWNIHTLCYVLMLIVIFSGFFGVFTYLRYPSLMTQNLSNSTRGQMLEEIAELDKSALQLADQVDQSIHDVVLRSIQRTKLGGGFWQQLNAQDASQGAVLQLRKAVLARKPAADQKKPAPGSGQGQTMVMMVDFLTQTQSDKQAEALRKLLDTMSRKQMLAGKCARDIQLAALMEIWLYVHVPLSFGLLATLIAHIVSVFFYW